MHNLKVTGTVWWAAFKDADDAVGKVVGRDADAVMDAVMDAAVWWSDAVDEVVHEIVYVVPTSPALQDFMQEARKGAW